ncbi:MAG TPA: hypothetical protein V6D22_17060 [Candidatus Obscuribacterales bacterium]
MPAPRPEPRIKTTITIDERLFKRLMNYPGPGTLSDRIETLCQYALQMGAWMTPDEAREIAETRAMEMFRMLPPKRKKR